MRLKNLIPNIITTCSLVLSLSALHLITQGHFTTASWLILLAILCDGIDGKLARALNATSSFGAEYDSLVDFVSFGVVPGYLFYRIGLDKLGIVGAIACFFYVICGAYRLVRYNLKNPGDGKKGHFEGLPIPAAAGFISSMTLFEERFSAFHFPEGYLVVILPAIALLMISHIEFINIGSPNGTAPYKSPKLYIAFALVVTGIFYPYIIYMTVMALYIFYCIIRYIIINIIKGS